MLPSQDRGQTPRKLWGETTEDPVHRGLRRSQRERSPRGGLVVRVQRNPRLPLRHSAAGRFQPEKVNRPADIVRIENRREPIFLTGDDQGRPKITISEQIKSLAPRRFARRRRRRIQEVADEDPVAAPFHFAPHDFLSVELELFAQFLGGPAVSVDIMDGVSVGTDEEAESHLGRKMPTSGASGTLGGEQLPGHLAYRQRETRARVERREGGRGPEWTLRRGCRQRRENPPRLFGAPPPYAGEGGPPRSAEAGKDSRPQGFCGNVRAWTTALYFRRSSPARSPSSLLRPCRT